MATLSFLFGEGIGEKVEKSRKRRRGEGRSKWVKMSIENNGRRKMRRVSEQRRAYLILLLLTSFYFSCLLMPSHKLSVRKRILFTNSEISLTSQVGNRSQRINWRYLTFRDKHANDSNQGRFGVGADQCIVLYTIIAFTLATCRKSIRCQLLKKAENAPPDQGKTHRESAPEAPLAHLRKGEIRKASLLENLGGKKNVQW